MVNSLMYRIKLDKTAGLPLIGLRTREINVQKNNFTQKCASTAYAVHHAIRRQKAARKRSLSQRQKTVRQSREPFYTPPSCASSR